MKRALSILRKGKIFIQGYSQTTAGIWVGMGAVYIIDETQVDELGFNVIKALNESSVGVRHPDQTEWKSIQAPMLKAAGVKTWATLAKGAKAVGLEYEEGRVIMVPSRNYENNGGVSVPESAIQCSFVAEELGYSLLEASRSCDN